MTINSNKSNFYNIKEQVWNFVFNYIAAKYDKNNYILISSSSNSKIKVVDFYDELKKQIRKKLNLMFIGELLLEEQNDKTRKYSLYDSTSHDNDAQLVEIYKFKDFGESKNIILIELLLNLTVSKINNTDSFIKDINIILHEANLKYEENKVIQL